MNEDEQNIGQQIAEHAERVRAASDERHARVAADAARAAQSTSDIGPALLAQIEAEGFIATAQGQQLRLHHADTLRAQARHDAKPAGSRRSVHNEQDNDNSNGSRQPSAPLQAALQLPSNRAAVIGSLRARG